MPGYDLTDTIVASATPLAPSAIGIVRLAGSRAWDIAAQLLNGLPQRDPIEPRHAYVCTLNIDGATDTCVALLWQAPHSYTGDDMAELMLHGSPALLRAVLTRCAELGARPAEAGEFTYRAYVAGKLDLSQAEAVQELIAAGSSRALSLASAQLAGLPGKRIRAWQAQLTDLLANIEVIHDYAADDLDASLDQATLLTTEKLRLKLEAISTEMQSALDATARTAQLRSGITVAICGPPNVGKSTLFNALLGHERALTAPEPGTTRDYLSETVESAGVRLTLVDTAGQREASDSVEAAGVAHAVEWARGADRVLWVQAADAATHIVPPEFASDAPLHVVTRCDVLPQWPASENGAQHVSGLTGQGVGALWKALLQFSGEVDVPVLESLSGRQAEAVGSAQAALKSALRALDEGMPMDAAAVDIYNAQAHLHGVFEQADRNDVIGQVFSGFCVGK